MKFCKIFVCVKFSDHVGLARKIEGHKNSLRWQPEFPSMGLPARVGRINAYRISVGKYKGKMLFGRGIQSRENNIKTNLKEIIYEVVNWIEQVQDVILCGLV
jgi:hypothetical protein